jgi:hypothetical protein
LRGPAFCFIDQVAEFLGKSGLTLSRGVCGYLHRDGEELLPITIDVAPQQRLDLLCSCHVVIALDSCPLPLAPAALGKTLRSS